MAFTGAGVDPGNSPTLVVAVEQIAGLDFQAIKIVDGTPGSTTPVGTSANPLHVDDADTQAALAAIEATLTGGISVTTGGLTDTQLRNTPVPVTNPDESVSGSITANGQVITLPLAAGQSIGLLDVIGTFSLTLLLEVLVDGTNWIAYPAGESIQSTTGLVNSSATLTSGAVVHTRVNVAGYQGIRVRCSAYVSGTAAVTLRAADGVGPVFLAGGLPPSSSTIGNAGIIGGGNIAAVKPASSAAIATDPALVVSISPNTQPTVLISGATLDGATFTPGAGTAFRGALYVVDETTGSTVAEDALGLARMDSKRAQIGVIEDATTRGQRAAVDASGRLAVNVQASTSLNLNAARADNAAFATGSTTAIPASFLVDEVAGGTATEDAAGIARMDPKRAQVLVLEDATTRGNRAAVDANGNQAVALKGGPTAGASASITATTSTTVFATSASAKERTIMNDSDQDCLVGFGISVNATTYHVRVKAGGGFISTNFSGSLQVMMVAAIGTGQCLAGQMTG